MTYVLLKKQSGEIEIIDNSNHIGKKKVEKFCNEGAVSAGTIESDLSVNQLMHGLNCKTRRKLDAETEKLWRIKDFVNEI